MKKNKSNSTIDIFRASMVVDYVAGTLGDEDRLTFENLLSESPALQRAVESEHRLRNTLTNLEQSDSEGQFVNDDGIDKLFAKIDKLEQQTGAGAVSTSRTPNRHAHHSWYAMAGVAASIAFVAVMFINFQTVENDSNFVLLGDDITATQIDFNQLVLEQKIAQVWLANELQAKDLPEVFAKHGLRPISRAGEAWIVTSARTLSKQHLQDLERLESINKAKLIAYDQPTASAKD